MTLTPLERDLLEADELRTKLEALTDTIRVRARELRTAAAGFDASTGPVAGALANAFRVIANTLERDAERWKP